MSESLKPLPAQDEGEEAEGLPGVHPPEGEQEKSHESEETLSPDEKSTG